MENNFCDISVDDFVELFRNAQVMHSPKVKILALEFGISKNQQNFDWLFFLMDFIHQPNEECKLRLRENTVQALRKIGW